MRYTKDNIGKYRQRLLDLGISDEGKMVELMNFLAQLAEIQIEADNQRVADSEIDSIVLDD